MDEVRTGGNSRQGRVLILLGIVFVSPFALSWWMYYHTGLGRDGGAYSHGELILPPRPLPDMPLSDLDGVQGKHRLHGKWSLLYLFQGECGQECVNNLYAMRQLWLATGDDSHRVQRILVRFPSRHGPYPSAWHDEYRGQMVAVANAEAGRDLLKAVTLPGFDRPLSARALYLVDPLGNLLMYYPAGTEPAGIIKDLMRLLKYSRIG